MKVNTLIDITGRFLVMGWIWVFILDYILVIESQRTIVGIFPLIFTVWWALLPLEKKEARE